MKYLVLCIFMNVWVYVAFRLFARYKIDNLTAIVINYFVCVGVGVILLPETETLFRLSYITQWGWVAFLLGALFILNFFLIALTTQRSGLVTSSVASKVSLVIPMIMSILFIGLSKAFDWLNYAGLFFAVAAVFFTAIKKDKLEIESNLKYFYLPLLVFLLSGSIDTIINFSNFFYLDVGSELLFPTFIFLIASVLGILILIMKNKKINIKNILGGIFLGVPNFLAVFFLLKTLTAFDNDGAIVYSSVNLGVIILTSIFSVIFFGEKPNKLNWLGLFLAVFSLVLVYHQEIMRFLKLIGNG